MPAVPNRISATLNDDEISRVLTLMDDIEKAMPFLQALEQHERKTMIKFGDSKIGFMDLGYELVKQDTSFSKAVLKDCSEALSVDGPGTLGGVDEGSGDRQCLHMRGQGMSRCSLTPGYLSEAWR